MRRAIVVALSTGALISSAAALSFGTGEGSTSVSRTEYELSRKRIETLGLAALGSCEARPAADRELCRTEAQAREMVRVAELERDYRGTQQAARALQRARIDARYQVDRARCGAMGGFRREKCLVRVHATRGRSLLEAGGPYETRF